MNFNQLSILLALFQLFNYGHCSIGASTNNHPHSTTFNDIAHPELSKFSKYCPEGQFKCNSTEKCIEQHQNCDGIVNCPDKSDESNCVDTSSNIYVNNFYQKQPSGRSDYIPIGSCFWADSNIKCPCRGTELLCRFQNLTNLPQYLPKNNLSMLDLTANHFPVITKDFFRNLPVLEILVLKFCSISKLEELAFEIFSKIDLKTLYLDENKIESLPENLFTAGNSIETLILSSNHIKILHPYDFLHLGNLRKLNLNNNQIITFTANVFQPLIHLKTLHLNGNRIKRIQPNMFPKMEYLQSLYLTNNQIEIIQTNSFQLPQLTHLFLAINYIKNIEHQTFCGLPELQGLNLDQNMIEDFQLGAFDCIENVTSLDLKQNPFKSLNKNILGNLTKLKHIYFSWFHLCRTAMHVRICEPKSDGISSAYHLLDNPVLRSSVWIMSAIGVIGNSIVLLSRFCSGKPRTHVDHILYLRHLAASDLLMGIYLALIALADYKYRGEYLINDELWRYSTVCSLCGFLSTLSCQSSTLLLTLITWDRLVSVTQPLQVRASGKSLVALRLSTLWGISVAAAVAPFSYPKYFGEHFYGNNGVCLSLHIHDPYAKGWEYSAGLFIVINTFSLAFIIVSYVRMLQAIRGSGEAMRSTISGRENIVAKRFAIIVATDCICWLPIILVKLVALGGVRIPSSLYAWLAVLVLPVNSALNPVLYTLTTASFKQQIRRYFRKLPIESTRQSRSQTNSISLGQFQSGSHRKSKRLLNPKLSYV